MPSPPPASLLRLLDALLNRSAEGLRVVEDYARFVLDDGHLTKLTKNLRHSVGETSQELAIADLRLACRDTQQDVGAVISTPTEHRRDHAWGVCQASLHRVHEALRSLEEYSKTLNPQVGARFEKLRYQSYTLAKALDTTRRNRERLADARLCVLIAGGPDQQRFERLASELLAAGADLLQLRDKQLNDQELIARAEALATIARDQGKLAIINDRADIAVASRASGVHLGQDDLSIHQARSLLGPEALIGRSTHSIEQARQAVLDGADYAGLGPTFPSQTKQFDEFPGTDYLQAYADEITLPAFAIGGVQPENLPQVLEAGASRIAVSSAVTHAKDPAGEVRKLKEQLAAGAAPTPVGG